MSQQFSQEEQKWLRCRRLLIGGYRTQLAGIATLGVATILLVIAMFLMVLPEPIMWVSVLYIAPLVAGLGCFLMVSGSVMRSQANQMLKDSNQEKES